jgi:hypothetical protein
VTKIDIGIVGGYLGKAHAVAMNAVAAVFDTPLRPSRSSVGSWWDAYDWRGVMKIVHGSLRHREQSEATQTPDQGSSTALSLGCFAVARNDGFPRLQLTGFDDG